MKEVPKILVADLGGTKVLAGIVSGDGKLQHRRKRESAGDGELKDILANLYAALDDVLAAAASSPAAVALASAGAIDLKKGVVTHSPNMMAVNGAPLRELLSQRYGIPAVMLNDASAAALAEHHLGAGRGSRDMIFLTVSTGIGGGIIVDNKLYQGADGTAGEFGHTIIDLNGPADTCGGYGCLEQYASGTAIARKAVNLLNSGVASSLADVLARQGRITAADVAAAALSGDPLAKEVFDAAMRALGTGIISIVNVFNPELIVIGGGVSQTGEQLFAPVRRAVAEHAYKLPASRVKIVPAALGDEAGAVGAALFAREELGL
ncbi:MAG: ROK family protein [Dehalogenimonas sp.]|uniref:ROK family protein n=1 Tax=Candidatus Dehalogenimonas loeffleri TaxID=3127115 RepID=A0ABZ2J532_9CHLR|nr:ROK family protein [Dehalogenimonas sp.]